MTTVWTNKELQENDQKKTCPNVMSKKGQQRLQPDFTAVTARGDGYSNQKMY